MKPIRLLALRRVRVQPLRAVVAILTIAAGVSLGVAILVVTSSIDRSVHDGVRAYAGPTELRVVGPTVHGGLVPATIDTAAKTDGVAAAVPVVQALTYAVVDSTRQVPVVVLGVDCRIEHLVGAFGCNADAFGVSDGGPIVVAPRLAALLGGQGQLRTDTGRIQLTGAIAVPALDALNEGNAVVLPLARAQRLFGRGDRFDVAYIATRDGVDVSAVRDRLERTLGSDIGVLRADDPPAIVGQALRAFLPLFTLLAILTLAIGGVLVHNTVRLSMAERRRQHAIVAALGGTTRTLAGGPIVEAGVLGLVGGVLGAAGGVLVATPILGSLESFTRKAAGISLHVVVEPSTIVIAALLGVAVGVVGAVRPVRQALRVDIAAELANRDAREDATPRNLLPRAIGWSATTIIALDVCALAAHNGSIEPWQAAIGPLAFVVATVAVLLLGAALAPLAITWIAQRVQPRRGVLRLALANLAAEPARTAVMVIALSTALGTAVVTASFNRSINHAIDENLTRNLRGVQVSAYDDGNAFNLDAALSEDVVAKIAALPGAARVNRAGGLTVGTTSGDLLAVTAFEDPWLDAAVYEGTNDRTRFDTGMALIGPALARSKDLHPGGSLSLATPTGTVAIPVLGVIDNGDFGGSAVLIPYDLLTKLYGPQPAGVITVDPKPGTSADDLLAQVRGAPLGPDVHAKSVSEVADDSARQVASQLNAFWVLQRALLLMAFVAVLSTLLLVGIQRQRQLGLLAAVGMTPREIAGMVLAEAGMVGVCAVLLGAPSSIAMYGGLLLVGPIIIGYHDPFVVDYTTMAVYAVVTLVVAIAGAWWPARRSARVEVLDALRYE